MSWAKVFGATRNRCPNCGSSDVHRSQMRGFVERHVLRAIGIHACRCERCDRRYYGFHGVEAHRDTITGHKDE